MHWPLLGRRTGQKINTATDTEAKASSVPLPLLRPSTEVALFPFLRVPRRIPRGLTASVLYWLLLVWPRQLTVGPWWWGESGGDCRRVERPADQYWTLGFSASSANVRPRPLRRQKPWSAEWCRRLIIGPFSVAAADHYWLPALMGCCLDRWQEPWLAKSGGWSSADK